VSRDYSTGDIHALAGAYALDALTEIERASFDRHAAECDVCAIEVAELQETTAKMADATWSVPPPRLRRAVLDEVARTPQVAGRRREDTRVAQAAATRWRRRTALAVAAGILVAGGGVATWSIARDQINDRDNIIADERRQAQQISNVLSAPDAKLSRNGQLSIVTSAANDSAVAVVDNLGPAGAGQVYQLWMIGGDGPKPDQVMRPGQQGGTFLITKNVTGATQFAVSREQAPGSRTGQPTLPAVAGVSLV
jgi:anti-sigma-K factor RskA